MGQSTNGIIAYGVPYPDGFEFPWDTDEFDDDAEDWWRETNGYEPPFELYDASSATGYAGGATREEMGDKISEYIDHGSKWLKENPMPFELENYCSGDYPMWFLAVPGSVMTAYRGYPEIIEPFHLTPDPIALRDFVKFLEGFPVAKDEYIDDGEPAKIGWYLFSCWN